MAEVIGGCGMTKKVILKVGVSVAYISAHISPPLLLSE